MRKGHIKDTLKESYTTNIDYKIIKGESTGLKGKPKEIILLTPKCFKIMPMQSKTKRAVDFSLLLSLINLIIFFKVNRIKMHSIFM